ncbi:Stage III sporulation protein AH [Paenibacillus solanacearum]|uniref:Stage III sporulation protein AH n=1 Tax=Paenibacillus solanacearum TaxID=2048548 RepID=A0A916JXN9_9BACL|nr:SpoIIIAH-like family protein [Paenibacillus solanacearum]CAG7612437.1 Stage III sporulation protein AH [Paenibacillus solanacearum]
MNSKRQTVWLVSMLSLMVVLSAYYLFTEDASTIEVGQSGSLTKEITITGGQLDGKQPAATGTNTNAAPSATDSKSGAAPADASKQTAPVDGAKTSESKESSIKTDTPSSAKPDAKSGAAATEPASKASSGQISKEDAKVLQQMQTQAKSGADYFVSLQMARDEELAKQVEKLVGIISDPKQTAEAAAKAQEDMRKIEDMEAKVTNLEEVLMKDFKQAVITQDASKWKVTVQATKLERSQALSIADKAMKELGIAADHLSIQYIP